MIIRTAKGPIKWFLKLSGFKGITSLWNVVYILEGYEGNADLLRHEGVHLEQMKRDGKFKFVCKYLWYTLRYGYWNNPYEKEARGP